MQILDLHTHNIASSEGIISCSPQDFNSKASGYYSVGLHPWKISDDYEVQLELLKRYASLSQVVAIGETGIDLVKSDALLYKQIDVFKEHIEISEQEEKPLIIHSVKAHDIISSLRRELMPKQAWIIHGFRGKPSIAEIYLKAGCKLSFGQFFNTQSLKSVSQEEIFAETDDADIDIHKVIRNMSEVYGYDLTPIIATNLTGILKF